MTDPSPLRPERWDAAYRSRVPDRVTWYQGRPKRSLSFIAATGFDSRAAVVPVGDRVIIATFALDDRWPAAACPFGATEPTRSAERSAGASNR